MKIIPNGQNKTCLVILEDTMTIQEMAFELFTHATTDYANFTIGQVKLEQTPKILDIVNGQFVGGEINGK